MIEFALTAKSPLGGARLDLEGLSIREITDHALVSIAVPRDGRDTLDQALTRAYGIGLPIVGRSTLSPAQDVRLLGLQRDQVFLFTDGPGDTPAGAVADKLGDAGYYTDQSDSWAIVELTGLKCRDVLERVCPIDLDSGQFPDGAVTRTQMEHLGVIILRNGPDSFRLFSATSSARSFLRMIKTSAINVL